MEDIEVLEKKIDKDYKDMMSVINSTSLPLFVEDTIEDMHILIENLIARNKELESDKQQLKFENNLLKQDIKNMYHQEAIISILEEEFNLNREESIEILENY